MIMPYWVKCPKCKRIMLIRKFVDIETHVCAKCFKKFNFRDNLSSYEEFERSKR